MKLILPISIVLSAIAIEAPGALADYTLELKNGRHITVQSYREDRGMIKFTVFGGEIGISKDNIQSIRQTAATDSGSLNLGLPQASAPQTTVAAPRSTKPETPRERPLNQEEERAKEERQYQDKLRTLTEQLKSAREQYADAQNRARNDDITSRFKDAQRNPSPLAPVKLLVPSPFSSLPPQVENLAARPPPDLGKPQAETDSERALSEMRNRATQLDEERERLINEMRQKNLKTGSLFLE